MRDLALEVYFSRWRSAARHDLTSSDSETLGLAELLEHGRCGGSPAVGNVATRLHRSAGQPLAARDGRRRLRVGSGGIGSLLRRRSGRHLRGDARAPGRRRSRHRRHAELPIDRERAPRALRGDRRRTRSGARLVARHRRRRGRRPAQHPPRFDQFPEQSDRQDPGARSLRRARRAVPPAWHLALQRRDLSVDRARSGDALACGGGRL